jgi:hypothetical protein
MSMYVIALNNPHYQTIPYELMGSKGFSFVWTYIVKQAFWCFKWGPMGEQWYWPTILLANTIAAKD